MYNITEETRCTSRLFLSISSFSVEHSIGGSVYQRALTLTGHAYPCWTLDVWHHLITSWTWSRTQTLEPLHTCCGLRLQTQRLGVGPGSDFGFWISKLKPGVGLGFFTTMDVLPSPCILSPDLGLKTQSWT